MTTPGRAFPWRRAAGELAVIIAGVLIALRIGERREGRVDEATRQEYLERLEAGLVADSSALVAHPEGRERSMASALRALRFVQDG